MLNCVVRRPKTHYFIIKALQRVIFSLGTYYVLYFLRPGFMWTEIRFKNHKFPNFVEFLTKQIYSKS